MKDESLENNLVTLYARGWSIRQLSREFGVSRERVGRILLQNQHKRETGSEYGLKPTKRATKLDPFKEYIGELLETYKNPPPTIERIFELILEKGYQGGRTIVGYYLSSVRGKQSKEPIICVETSPGQRASHDWSEYYIYFSGTGKKEKVIFFSYILNYSRRQYLEVVEDKIQSTLFQCLINSFIYFDGVPLQIKSDNQKVCVDRWEFGRAVFNKTFLDFASHYCFAPLTIHPGKPRENLKVERPFYYLEKNFLNARSFFDIPDLKKQLSEWLLMVNDQRIHRTTRRKPIDLFSNIEFALLQRLPRKQYDTSTIEYRVVNNESCIEWQGYYYVVPARYMYETCPVRGSREGIIIYGSGFEEIIRYALPESGSNSRYIGRRPQSGKTSYPKTKEVILRLQALGHIMDQYIEQVKRHKPTSYRHHLMGVLSLKVNYHRDDIIMAVRRALNYKVYEYGAIENFLSVNAEKKNEIKLFPRNRSRYEKE